MIQKVTLFRPCIEGNEGNVGSEEIPACVGEEVMVNGDAAEGEGENGGGMEMVGGQGGSVPVPIEIVKDDDEILKDGEH